MLQLLIECPQAQFFAKFYFLVFVVNNIINN